MALEELGHVEEASKAPCLAWMALLAPGLGCLFPHSLPMAIKAATVKGRH